MGRRRRRVDGAAGALPEAIAALSRSLPGWPSPEVFRRAKFDRPEAAPALWQLLFRLLTPPPADCALAPEAQANLVKSALRVQGYPRLTLSQLPEGSSQGSRELLLALSWLLARGPLFEQLLTQSRVQLGDHVPQCQCEAVPSFGPPTPLVDTGGPVDLRQVQWMMGKLRLRWRRLTSSQLEQCALLSKIHLYTRGCHSDQRLCHLSVAETEMIRDPEEGRQLLRALECENARLEAALEWQGLELVYWQWMVWAWRLLKPTSPLWGTGRATASSSPLAVTSRGSLSGHSPGRLSGEPHQALAACAPVRDLWAQAWQVGAGNTGTAFPAGGAAGAGGAPQGCLAGPGWRPRPGTRVEYVTESSAEGCGAGAAGPVGVLGAPRGLCLASGAPPPGENGGWDTRGPGPASRRGDQDAEDTGGLSGGSTAPAAGRVSEGAGQGGRGPAWTHLDPATQTLRAAGAWLGHKEEVRPAALTDSPRAPEPGLQCGVAWAAPLIGGLAFRTWRVLKYMPQPPCGPAPH